MSASMNVKSPYFIRNNKKSDNTTKPAFQHLEVYTLCYARSFKSM